MVLHFPHFSLGLCSAQFHRTLERFRPVSQEAGTVPHWGRNGGRVPASSLLLPILSSMTLNYWGKTTTNINHNFTDLQMEASESSCQSPFYNSCQVIMLYRHASTLCTTRPATKKKKKKKKNCGRSPQNITDYFFPVLQKLIT